VQLGGTLQSRLQNLDQLGYQTLIRDGFTYRMRYFRTKVLFRAKPRLDQSRYRFLNRYSLCARFVGFWSGTLSCTKPPLGEEVEKSWRGEPPERPPKAAGPPGVYPELGEGGATRSEIALVNGALRANVSAQ
jgi:hypothetical protein